MDGRTEARIVGLGHYRVYVSMLVAIWASA